MNGQLQRVSATSTITSDYFSMNSKEVPPVVGPTSERPTPNGSAPKVAASQTQMYPPSGGSGPRSGATTSTLYPNVVNMPPCGHQRTVGGPPNHDADNRLRGLQEPSARAHTDIFCTTNMPLPPPPPQYNDSRPLCELEVDLCRKLSCGGQCHSQDSLNSGYSDIEEEDLEAEELEGAEVEENGYYHIMPRKNIANNDQCPIESHSCQTNYEDHATQTEDEDDDYSEAERLAHEELKDEAVFPAYGKS